jgi:hypothetical protein
MRGGQRQICVFWPSWKTAKEYLAERRPVVEGRLSKIVAKAVAMALGVFERLPPTQVGLKIRLQSVYMIVCVPSVSVQFLCNQAQTGREQQWRFGKGGYRIRD